MSDRTRIRRPRQLDQLNQLAPSTFAAQQQVRDLYLEDVPVAAASASAGHNFGRIAVSSPAPATAPTARDELQAPRQHFSVTINRTQATGERQAAPTSALASTSLHAADAEPGSEEHQLLPTEQIAATSIAGQVVAIPEPAEGETVTFPDIIMPVSLVTTDSVHGVLTFASTIAESADDPGAGNFGLTEGFAPVLSNIKVTATAGSYHATADLNGDVNVKVRATTGPAGQVDIDGVDDADITSDNYGLVVSDLTPNSHDLSGRPPRTKFWAHDLTVIHERFHAGDFDKFFKQGTTQAQTWLNRQAADSATAVNALLNQVPNRIISVVAANMAPPDSEKRAYADGAASYTARAHAIRTKGDAHKYPAPPAP
jgi:hypothetical protein